MLTITDYESYFTALGAAHKSITATEKLDLYDVQSTIEKIRDLVNDTILLIETYSVGKQSLNADNVHDINAGAILIMQGSNDPRGDKETIRSAILANTERIANSFEARIKYDMERAFEEGLQSNSDNKVNWLANLDINSIVREKIGPDLGGRYGWRIQFHIKTYNPMIVIPSMWNDL
jgi:hypothetical protein